jgi:hypothetical protein
VCRVAGPAAARWDDIDDILGTIRARDVISSHARARVREERRSSDADARIDREGGGGDDSASDGDRGERG